MRSCRALAPAKVNLGLFLGPTRASDGRHELVTVMQSISLADELTLELAQEGVTEDEVFCPGVPGPPAKNLAGRALAAFRKSTGWEVPPLRLSIDKRIPVAAGMGGGSADAAAALRLARYASGLGDEELLRELGADLGADVPAQISPGCWLASGAGERLYELPDSSLSLGLLVLPVDAELATAAVYAEADRLGLGRAPQALEDRRRALLAAWTPPAPGPGAWATLAAGLLHNDLQDAAIALCPEIADALRQAREAGSDLALVSGSGPTVVGLFVGDQGRAGSSGGGGDASLRNGGARAASLAPAPSGASLPASARRSASAAAGLAQRVPTPICATPVDAAFARALPIAGGGPPAG